MKGSADKVAYSPGFAAKIHVRTVVIDLHFIELGKNSELNTSKLAGLSDAAIEALMQQMGVPCSQKCAPRRQGGSIQWWYIKPSLPPRPLL